MLTIIDYGIGNLNSVANMIRHVGGQCCITGNPDHIAAADKLILPGVGAFDCGISALRESGILEALNASVFARKVPILGICLGMQLMTNRSDEGVLPGLKWINAEVRKFSFASNEIKIPHMGWNTLSVQKVNPLISVGKDLRFYFVHSYHVACKDPRDIVATCCYGYDFVAAFAHENIFGVQFHPEKSHRFGMSLMKRFVEI